MRMLMTLVGYVCTATVLSVTLGLAYLYGTNRVDDEKMFRMVALLHDVDVDRIAEETGVAAEEIPDEEPSPEDVRLRRQILARNHEVKMEALKRGKLNFDASLSALITEKDRFDEIATKLQKELEEEGELSNKQSVQKVVQNLELMKADQAKEELRRILQEEDGVADVIKLTKTMNTNKLKKILQRFILPEEQEELHTILQSMLNGGPQQEVFENALEELNKLKSK
ncbi:hypothetical protein Pla123a_18760 [Posidoniimonas polymericola]|uniref:MgtE intracellular N domain protein n=1 Tax=Posidoniimonas polymericola TaxID=2528002 RepID=A0A5C5YQL4_9BACT|nr:hypothetical protein [Posidoniimonas polymericola]TWT77221.1 hypothetical protein Pla123a_18760 [Posidoniimonas polymericola]